MPETRQPAPQPPEPTARDHRDLAGEDEELDLEAEAICQEALELLGAELDVGSGSEQMLKDRRIVEALKKEDFTGDRAKRYYARQMDNAYPIIDSWLATGQIFQQSARLGVPVQRRRGDTPPWSRQDRSDLASETVITGRARFESSLRREQWDWRKGASLATFFVGACILAFPQVYSTWFRRRVMLGEMEQLYLDDSTVSALVRPGPLVEHNGPEDPAAIVTLRDEADRALADLPTQELRQVAVLQGMGYPRSEAAQKVGITPKAAERGIANHRTRLERERAATQRPEDTTTTGQEEQK